MEVKLGDDCSSPVHGPLKNSYLALYTRLYGTIENQNFSLPFLLKAGQEIIVCIIGKALFLHGQWHFPSYLGNLQGLHSRH